MADILFYNFIQFFFQTFFAICDERLEADYNKAAEELAKAQTALDVINNTIEFEVEL